MTLWIALSVTAGICEEAIYRGYLQRQFMALTKNVPAGILFSAVLFGLAHSYQGFWRAIPIAIDGALLGTLAYWRKTVRPRDDCPCLEGRVGAAAHGHGQALVEILTRVKDDEHRG